MRSDSVDLPQATVDVPKNLFRHVGIRLRMSPIGWDEKYSEATHGTAARYYNTLKGEVMKSPKSHSLATTAVMILSLVWGTCQAWAGAPASSHSQAQAQAKKLPLLNPWRVALDSKGNLYVANYDGNNILVYGPQYVQKPALTITSDISQPSGVAFDSQGNLYVSNVGSNSITVYTPT